MQTAAVETGEELKQMLYLHVCFRGLPAERNRLANEKEEGGKGELEEEMLHDQFEVLMALEKKPSEIGKLLKAS